MSLRDLLTIPEGVGRAADVVAGLDQCFLTGFGRLGPGHQQALASLARIGAPGLIVFGLLMFGPLSQASRSHFYLGANSLSQSVQLFRDRSFGYPFLSAAFRLADLISLLTGPALIVSLLLLLLRARPSRAPARNWGTLLLPITCVAVVGALIACITRPDCHIPMREPACI